MITNPRDQICEIGHTELVGADEPTLQGREWIGQQWDAARLAAVAGPAILVLDEVQKVSDWSDAVKARWDEEYAEAGLS